MKQEPPSRSASRNGSPCHPKKLILTRSAVIPERGPEDVGKITKRNLRQSAVITATAFTLILTLLAVWKVILPHYQDTGVDVFYISTDALSPFDTDSTAEKIPTSAPSRDPEVPLYIPAPEITIASTPNPENIALPSPDMLTPTLSLSAMGLPSGTGLSSLPSEFGHRCSERNRLQRLKQSGGLPEYDEAVTRGLLWLSRNQNEDGSWGTSQKCAMTGLALLSFMARCETPYSEEFGETSQKAISYLISIAYKNRGVLSETPTDSAVCYEHAMATYALAEALTLCNAMQINIYGLAPTVRRAAQYIILHQGHYGSWYYFYYTQVPDGAHYPDLSITGWNVQALLAARRTRLSINGMDESLQKAISFIKSTCDVRTGMFAYTGNTYRASMTCVGSLLLQLLGQYRSQELECGMGWIQKHLLFPDYMGKNWDLYMEYYCAQVMINHGGKLWREYAKNLGNTLLSHQKEDGSWPPPGNTSLPGNLITANGLNGHVYRNSMCLLTLTTFYRYQITPPKQ